MLRLSFFLIFIYACIVSSCVEPIRSHTAIPPGIWRGELNVEGGLDIVAAEIKDKSEVALKDVKSGRLPFNFEVKYDSKDQFYIEIINGSERIEVRDIYFGKDKKTLMDTIRIDFPMYDSYISGIYRENVIQGEWVVNYRPAYRIPFLAYHGQNHRFSTVKKKPSVDLTGNWQVEFSPGTEDAYPAIGEFKQMEDGQVTGTFQTETGDYRFLEGCVLGEKVYLSCFDGAHAFLFEAKLIEDGSLIGIFQSGMHYNTEWTANKNENASLTNPYELTYLKPGFDKFEFSMQNIEGGTLSLSDEKFKNKVKLIKIMGTWCPNCRDASLFLKDYLKQNPNENLAVISIGFEKYKDEAKAMKSLQRYKSKMDIPWDVVYGGLSDKTEALKSLPMLNQIVSYPTILFIDKKDQIRKIYTGFNGPATSEYAHFVKDFNNTVSQLLEE